MSNQRETWHTSAGEVICSVAAAFFGVQSARQRARDLTYGKPWHYLLAGLGMTAALVALFYGAVQLALRTAG